MPGPFDSQTDAIYTQSRQRAANLSLGDVAIGNGLGPIDQTAQPPPGLIQSVIKEESGGNPQAVSPKGALGLMQVMPETAREMGYTPEQMLDPRTALEAGTKYLMQQYQRFGDWRKALIAYNAGPGRVNNPPAESERYADDILSRMGQGGETGLSQLAAAGHGLIDRLHEWGKQQGFGEPGQRLSDAELTQLTRTATNYVLSMGGLSGESETASPTEIGGGVAAEDIAGEAIDQKQQQAQPPVELPAAAAIPEGAPPSGAPPGGTPPPPSAPAGGGGGEPPGKPPITLTAADAARALMERQAEALQQVEAGKVPVGELKNPLAQPVSVPEATTMERGRGLNWDLQKVYNLPMEPSEMPAQVSAAVQTFAQEATDLRAQTLDIVNKAANGEDWQQAYPDFANRWAAFAVQQAKLAGMRSATGRALEILDPHKPENLMISETARLAQQVMAGQNPEQLTEMAARLDPEQFARASRQMADDVKAGGSLLGGLQEYYRSNLLSNVGRTVSRVGLSNSIVSLMQLPLRLMASAMPGNTVQFGEEMAKAKGYFDAFPEAIQYGLKSLISGQNEKNLASGVQYMERGPQITSVGTRWEDTTFGRAIDYLGHIIRLPYHGLAGIHTFGQALEAGSEENALAWRTAMRQAQATGGGWKQAEPIYRQLLNNMPDDLRVQANEAARQTMFMGKFGKTGEWLAQAANIPGLNLIATFMRVPLNILKWNLQMIPLVGQTMDAKVLMGGPSQERDLALARLGLGSIIQGWAGWKVINGELTGDPPDNPTTRGALERQGVQWNSVKMGGKWVEIPEAIRPQMTLIANAYQMMHHLDAPTSGQIATALGVSLMHTLTSSPFMQGFADLIKAPSEAKQQGFGVAGERFLGSRLAGFVPASSFLRGVTKGAPVPNPLNLWSQGIQPDPIIHQAQTWLDTIKAGIPSLSGSVPAKFDIYGNVSEGLPGVPDNLLFPLHITGEKLDKVDHEIAATGANFRPVPQRIAGREQMAFDAPNDPAVGIDLNDAQRAQWAQFRGDGLKDRLSDLIDSDLYQGGTPAMKKLLIETWGHQAAQLADKRLLLNNPQLMQDYLTNRLNKRRALLPASTLGAP